MRRTIKVDVEDLLSLIICADMYGYRDDVLFDGFAAWLDRKLSDKEIEAAAKGARHEDDSEEDQDESERRAREALVEFRAQYMGGS